MCNNVLVTVDSSSNIKLLASSNTNSSSSNSSNSSNINGGLALNSCLKSRLQFFSDATTSFSPFFVVIFFAETPLYISVVGCWLLVVATCNRTTARTTAATAAARQQHQHHSCRHHHHHRLVQHQCLVKTSIGVIKR